MSTKIYGGIIFKGMSLNDVFPVIIELRKKCEEVKLASLKRVIVLIATGILDQQKLKPRKLKKIKSSLGIKSDKYSDTAISIARSYVKSRIQYAEKTMFRDTAIDFECNICLFPSGEDTLGIVLAENNAMVDVATSPDCIEDYSYWDNTDPPEDIDYGEWESRGVRWDKILGWDSLASRGLTAEITDMKLPGPTMDIDFDEVFIDLESRSKLIVNSLVEKSYRSMKDSLLDKVQDFCDWRESPEGRKVVSDETARVMAVLPEKYTMQDFNSKL